MRTRLPTCLSVGSGNVADVDTTSAGGPRPVTVSCSCVGIFGMGYKMPRTAVICALERCGVRFPVCLLVSVLPTRLCANNVMPQAYFASLSKRPRPAGTIASRVVKINAARSVEGMTIAFLSNKRTPPSALTDRGHCHFSPTSPSALLSVLCSRAGVLHAISSKPERLLNLDSHLPPQPPRCLSRSVVPSAIGTPLPRFSRPATALTDLNR
jgi:hypothetical protein